jgi:hypothetical protein
MSLLPTTWCDQIIFRLYFFLCIPWHSLQSSFIVTWCGEYNDSAMLQAFARVLVKPGNVAETWHYPEICPPPLPTLSLRTRKLSHSARYGEYGVCTNAIFNKKKLELCLCSSFGRQIMNFLAVHQMSQCLTTISLAKLLTVRHQSNSLSVVITHVDSFPCRCAS